MIVNECPGCGVSIGEKHVKCDIERCPACGHQAFGCDCVYDAARAMPWTGVYPGFTECREYGLYAKLVSGKGWQRCAPDDDGASEDLNTLMTAGRWNADTQRWVLPS